MSERGSYAKGRERREAILKATLDVFSQNEYRDVSLRAIARELNISPALLQHYFPSREELLMEVVSAWDAENHRLGDGMSPLGYWLAGIRHNAEIPGLVRLYTALAIEATDPGHAAWPYIKNRYDTLTAEIVKDVEAQKTAGSCDPDLDSERVTRLLIAACEGLQIRWLHSPEFDVYEDFVFLLKQLGITPPPEAKLLTASLNVASHEGDKVRS